MADVGGVAPAYAYGVALDTYLADPEKFRLHLASLLTAIEPSPPKLQTTLTPMTTLDAGMNLGESGVFLLTVKERGGAGVRVRARGRPWAGRRVGKRFPFRWLVLVARVSSGCEAEEDAFCAFLS